MNIVLVSHCNFLGQSAYHVHSLAKKLTERECSCIICVPDGQDWAKQYVDSDIPIINYEFAFKKGLPFSDNNGPTLIHCWTPREHVRQFTQPMADIYDCPYVVHLEDNEYEILRRELKSRGYEDIDRIDPGMLDRVIPSHFIHPLRYRTFMRNAAGVTVLIDRLLEHVPEGTPGLVFWPGYDEIFSAVPTKLKSELRKKYHVPDNSFVIYYSGNFHAINEDDVRQMTHALSMLKDQGIPIFLLKTGTNTLSDIAASDSFMTDLGFVSRAQLPELLAITDIVIQPGASDAFNDYRFPSKLPESLISGKALIMPRSNLGRFLADGVEALITETGSADELVRKVKILYDNRELRQAISVNGQAFARKHLQWDIAADKILAFYKEQSLPFVRFNQTTKTLTEQKQKREKTFAGCDEQIPNIDQTMPEPEVRTTGLYKSTMRRIEIQLRMVEQLLRRIGRIAMRMIAVVRHSGGMKHVIKILINLYRHEGLAGIKRVLKKISISGNRNDYAKWVNLYDTLTDEIRATMRNQINRFVRKPVISVVMPVYNPRQEWLIEAIESVRKQIYQHWELCIADDASTDHRIRRILESYAKEDPRIKIIYRKKNGNISTASNDAMTQASGDWIALLDHDDLLAEHALFWVAYAINQNPDYCLIYSDEDKIDGSGQRFDPYFKCDWNLDLFYSHNLISHLGVYRADTLKIIDGFREGLEGAQDYDLALRCVELINPKQIHHIPRVLYHWRAHVNSTANYKYAKPHALLAGAKALDEHFRRQRINAKTELLNFGMYRIQYALPHPMPLVSLIIPTRNKLKLLKRCIESILRKTTYSNYEILIVDNGSDDAATLQYLQELQFKSNILVVRDKRPFNFSALNNAAVKLARGDVIGLLNNDLEVISSEWLSEMVSHALRPGVGAVGARLWYSNDTMQHGGIVIGLGGVAGHSHKRLSKAMPGYFWRAHLIQNYSAVTAACLVIRKSVYEEVGGFNEENLSVAFNDVDFCLRVREKGYRNVWTPYAELYHHESATRGFESSTEKQVRFTREVQWMKQRWGSALLRDPAYSPNLTLVYEDFSLAWPPRVEPI